METVTRVIAREDFHLELTFNTGEIRLFDARPYLSRRAFCALAKPGVAQAGLCGLRYRLLAGRT